MPESTPILRDKRSAVPVLLATVAAALVAAVLLVEATGEILEGIADGQGFAAWDRPVLDWAIAQRTPGLTSFVAWYSNTGGPLWQPIVTGAVVLFLWWRWKDPTPLVLTLFAGGGSLVMTVFGKRLIERARPPLPDAVPPYESSFSFPSGHSLNAFVIAGILAYLIVRHLWDHPVWQRVVVVVLLGAYAATMGLSRVFLGHHWLTDVVGAWALGLAWLGVVIACHRVWRTVRHREEGRPIEEERKEPLDDELPGGPAGA